MKAKVLSMESWDRLLVTHWAEMTRHDLKNREFRARLIRVILLNYLANISESELSDYNEDGKITEF
jgi:hypothetical protein